MCVGYRENELERFLLEKGILWAEKGVAPVLIEGVFDPEKPLEKRIKAAAKFLSAEEEAAKRKMELESLKARSMMAGPSDIAEDELALTDPMAMPSSSSTTAVAAAAATDEASASVVAVTPDSSAATPAEAASVVSSGAVAPATNVIELANMSAVPATPTRTPRKHSILTHTNPELLNTLNKMFSSPAPHAPNSALRARTPNRRASVAIGATASSALKPAAAATEGDASAPKEIKKSKSKLLKKLLGEEEETASAPKPAFAATLPAGGLFGGPGGRPMSALAMAMGGGAGGPAGGGMSFLDQIKARRAKDDGDASSSSSSSASVSTSSGGDPLAKTISFPLPPAPPATANGDNAAPEMPFRRPPNPFAAAAGGAGGGGMSFLEQIKARRKSDD